MTKFLVSFFSLIISLVSISQTYTPTDAGSSVKFTIKNLGLNTTGSFTGLKGEVKYASYNSRVTNFNVSVDANTINTGISARDNHLRKEEYFSVAQYTTLHFISTKIVSATNGVMVLTGTLTIRGISKEVSFPFTVSPQGKDLLFKGSFSINRRDFKVGGNSMVLSDNVSINLQILAKKTP